jgi:hypothetical protein
MPETLHLSLPSWLPVCINLLLSRPILNRTWFSVLTTKGEILTASDKHCRQYDTLPLSSVSAYDLKRGEQNQRTLRCRLDER